MDSEFGITDELNILKEPSDNTPFTDFTSLECWKSARALRIQISAICKSFPAAEDKRLTDQMIRASRSVTNNIAEGSGRYHYKDTIKFYFVSRGSLHELKDHLLIAYEENYIQKEDFDAVINSIANTSKILNGYIKYVIGLAKKYNNHDYIK